MNPPALGRLRRGAVHAVRVWEKSWLEAKQMFLGAQKRLMASSDLRCELGNFFDSLEEGLPGEAVPGGARDGLAAILRRYEQALTGDGDRIWSARLRLLAMVTPTRQEVHIWLDNLMHQQIANDLWMRGDSKALRGRAQVELARARTDSSGSSPMEFGLAESLPAESLPAESLPAERLPAGWAAAEFDPAESPTRPGPC